MYDSDTGFFQYVKSERVLDIKHAGFGRHTIDSIQEDMSEIDFVPDVVITDSADEEYQELFGSGFGSKFENDPVFKLVNIFTDDDFKGAERFWIDHHYAHILSAWPLGKFDYGVAVDGRGPTWNTTMICKNAFNPCEVEIAYTNNHKNRDASFGGVFTHIGIQMGLKGQRIDFAGKVMGAHSYGTPQDISGIDLSLYREKISQILQPFHDYKGRKEFGNQEFIDIVATAHEIWESTLEDLVLEYVPRDEAVCLTGGAAQNTVFNERILKLYPKMQFVPHCYDGGLSLGGIGLICLLNEIPLPANTGFPYWQKDEVSEKPSQGAIKEVAQMLADGKIVGWHQGRGEIGPRALGNRSILMNPAIPSGKTILNEKVKHREHWRPYAASVLAEHASEWFKTGTPSPYMMRAIPVREDKKSIIPAVTHVDGTCRIQTISRSQNESFYDLIAEFHKLTGIPMLLNTSLNDGGKPISGSPDRSIGLMKSSEMDAVCVGKNIISDTLAMDEKVLRESLIRMCSQISHQGPYGLKGESVVREYDSPLVRLCKESDTDKWSNHSYVPIYEFLMWPSIQDLVEIGILKGNSIRVWEKYLPAANITGIDVDPDCENLEFERANTIIGSQMDYKFLFERLKGMSFDFVIDDGKHTFDAHILSAAIFSTHMKDESIYVIEDIRADVSLSDYSVLNGVPIDLVKFKGRGDDKILIVPKGELSRKRAEAVKRVVDSITEEEIRKHLPAL
jgi:carbamoyltransferase